MKPFDIISFDADDTLWQNELYYRNTEIEFINLLSPFHSPEKISEQLYKTETGNLSHYGYGVKSFALSMIETALNLTNGSVPAATIQSVIEMAKNMLMADVELLDHVAETITDLSTKYPLMVITKGDLLHQESKIVRSGLAPLFHHAEVISTKTPESYGKLLKHLHIDPNKFLMVGNSLPSDILPILELGGHAVYIPHDTTWAHEVADAPTPETQGYYQIDHIGRLPALLDQIETNTNSPKQ